MAKTRALFMVLPFLVCGCGTAGATLGPSSPTVPVPADGYWRVTSLDGLGVGCLFIQGGLVEFFDDGCYRDYRQTNRPLPVVRAGVAVVMVFGFTFDNVSANVTLTLTGVERGAYSGTWATAARPLGVLTTQILMDRIAAPM